MSMIPSFFGNRQGSSIFDPFSLDPFRNFPFSEFSHENSAIANARVDWKETPEAHLIKADLPGMKKEEVKVEIEDDRVLQISGERKVEKEEKNDTWHRVERSSGKFMRRFRLPENAKMDQVKASMENGVLTVTIPKEEVKKPEIKSIFFFSVPHPVSDPLGRLIRIRRSSFGWLDSSLLPIGVAGNRTVVLPTKSSSNRHSTNYQLVEIKSIDISG